MELPVCPAETTLMLIGDKYPAGSDGRRRSFSTKLTIVRGILI